MNQTIPHSPSRCVHLPRLTANATALRLRTSPLAPLPACRVPASLAHSRPSDLGDPVRLYTVNVF